MSTTALPPSSDPLSRLVHHLPATPAVAHDGVTSEPEGFGAIEDVVQIGADVRLVRRSGEFYLALVTSGTDVLPHQLDVGLGRLVWTLATGAPTPACERARRVLAEAGIVANDAL